MRGGGHQMRYGALLKGEVGGSKIMKNCDTSLLYDPLTLEASENAQYGTDIIHRRAGSVDMTSHVMLWYICLF